MPIHRLNYCIVLNPFYLKAETEMMVEDLRSAFKELVSETEWMDGETQKAAMMKADQMLQLMAYPEWLTHEQDLDQYYE